MTRRIMLDTETTGGSAKTGDKLIEIGMVETEAYVPTGRVFHAYLDPKRSIHWGATRVHGLTSEVLKGCPRFIEIAADMRKFIGGAKVLAHSAPFDKDFLKRELAACGVEPIRETQWEDTVPMCRKWLGNGRAKLDLVVEAMDLDIPDRKVHGALLDAAILAAVVARIKKVPDVDVAALNDKGLPLPGPLSKDAGTGFGKPRGGAASAPKAPPVPGEPPKHLRGPIDSVNARAPEMSARLYFDLKCGSDYWSERSDEELMTGAVSAAGGEWRVEPLLELGRTDRRAALRWVCRGLSPEHALCKGVLTADTFGRDVPHAARSAAETIVADAETPSFG